MSRALWIVAVVACSGPPAPEVRPPPPPPPVAIDAGVARVIDAPALDRDLPRLVERSLAMYRDVAAALAASTDCAVVARKLGELARSDRDVVDANAKVLHDGRAKELRAALEPHGEAFDASARTIVQAPTMAKCSQDAAFAKAFDELLEPPP